MKKGTPQEIKDMDKALRYLKRLPANELRYIVARVSQDLIPKAMAQSNPRLQATGLPAADVINSADGPAPEANR
jgi:hypothetical protein